MCNYKMSCPKQQLSLPTSFSVGFATLECLYLSCLGMHLSPFQPHFLWTGCVVLESRNYWSQAFPFPVQNCFSIVTILFFFFLFYSAFLFYSIFLILSKPDWKTTGYFNILESSLYMKRLKESLNNKRATSVINFMTGQVS